MTSATIDQCRTPSGLAYKDAGPSSSRSALICVPGWCCRADDFRYLFESWPSLLDRPFRAIALDLPGYGRTPSQLCPEPSIAAYGALVLDFCRDLQIEEVVLLGHSMGCRVVLDAWKQHQAVQKDKTLRVTIKGLIFLDGSHTKLRERLYSFDDKPKGAKAALTAEEKLNAKLKTFSGMFSEHTPQEFQDSTLEHLRALDPIYDAKLRTSHVDYDFHQMDDVLDVLGKSGTSFLNIQTSDVNAQTERVPLRQGDMTKWTEHLKTHVPQGKQVVIEDTLHFPHVDRPRAVAQALDAFVVDLLDPAGKR